MFRSRTGPLPLALLALLALPMGGCAVQRYCEENPAKCYAAVGAVAFTLVCMGMKNITHVQVIQNPPPPPETHPCIGPECAR